MGAVTEIPSAADPGVPSVTKAVIPAAGLGTRFLPATKAQPKEMLPVVDRPAIEYVVAEAKDAGLDDVLVITGRNKSSMEDHFDRNPSLEAALAAKGDEARLAAVAASSALAPIHYVRQGEARGLGHAVGCARDHVGNEPFVVLLGDDLIDPRDSVIPAMVDVRQRFGGSVLCLMEVPTELVHLYGCARVEETDTPDVVRVTELVEKPPAGTEPSNLVIVGRYLLDPTIFDVLDRTEPGRGGEIQLTDALAHLATRPDDPGGGVHAVVFRGRRYDTGDKLSFLQATVQLAVEHPEVGTQFRDWLASFVSAELSERN